MGVRELGVASYAENNIVQREKLGKIKEPMQFGVLALDLDKDFLSYRAENLPEGAEHWMVKFAARADARDAGPVEYAYSLMARAAGIEMPETRLFEVKHGRGLRRYFGVRRFDRATGNRRIHIHTFANLIHANFRLPSTDYADLFQVTRLLTRNHRDLLRLFRLMVFNVAAHNRDDHAKNFAFMLDDRTDEWSLAPAYDLTHSLPPTPSQIDSTQFQVFHIHRLPYYVHRFNHMWFTLYH